MYLNTVFLFFYVYACTHYVLHESLYKNGNKRESGVEGHGQKNWMKYKKEVYGRKLKFTKGTIKIGKNGINNSFVCIAQ